MSSKSGRMCPHLFLIASILVAFEGWTWADSVKCDAMGEAASTSTKLPDATIKQAYSARLQLTVTGVSPFTYSCSTTTDGAWLLIDPTNGALSGTAPDKPGTTPIPVTVTATDSATPKAAQTPFNFTLTVGSTPPATVVDPTSAGTIQLIGRIVEGTTTITGVGPTSSTIEIMDVDAGSPLLLQGGAVTTSADKTTGIFTATLANPLYSGQNIQVVTTGTGASVKTAKINIPGVADWGRVRANFAAGAVLSFDNNFQLTTSSSGGTGNSSSTSSSSGSQTTLFLAFDVEKNWKWAGVKNPATADAVPPPGSKDLPNATAGVAYSQPGPANKAGTFMKGNGPNWLVVDPRTGALSGTPEKAEKRAKVTIAFTDANKNSISSVYYITVVEPAGSSLGYGTQANTPASNASAAVSTAPRKFELEPGFWHGRTLFSTFVQARLTSVPVSVCTPSTSGGASSSTSCTGSNDNLSTFLSSAKSAEIQGGAYLPILTSVWSYQNAPNALYIAPIARVGFITPTSSATSPTTTTTTSPATTPTPTPAANAAILAASSTGSSTTSSTTTSGTQAVNSGEVYNFYAFGVRLGHFKLSSDKNSDPETLSYIDVMWGRYSNLESLVAGTGGGTIAERRWRIAIEALLKIPATPLVLGMSANIGQNLLGAPTVQGAKDDVRFFIGAKFDVGKLMSKLPVF